MAEKKNYRWRDENFYARVGNKVANRINAYQEKYNALQSDYQKRNEGRKYTYEDAYVSDSADWANSVAQRRSELDAEVDSISAYIDRFKDGLDSNWVKQFKSGLADTKKYQGMLADAAVKDHEWWSNFENEEAYKYAGRVDGYTQKYSGLTNEEIQNALANLDDGEERQWLQYNQGSIYGKNIRSQADFMQYSDVGSKLKYDDFDLKEQNALMKAGDEYLAAVAAVANHYGTENFSSKEYEEYTKIFNSLSEEEFQELAYCIAKDKENGLYYETDGGPVLKETSLTKQYLESKEKKLEYDRGVEIGNELKDKAFLADLYAAKMGLSNFSTGFKTFMGLDVGYAPGTTQVAGNTIRESFADDGFKLPDWMGGASARQAVFDLTSTTANQIPSIVVSSMLGTLNPVLGTASGISLMSGSAAGNAYMEAVDKGYGENEAKIYGAGVGILEGSLQYALGGISKLGGTGSKVTKAVAGINSGLARFALQWGGSMVSEGIEEGLQEVLDPILQNAILGEDENVDWGNVAYSALLGALSAGTLELGGTISKTRAQKALNNEIAKQYGGLAENIIREGLESGNGTVSERLAKQYKKQTEKGKSLTSSQVLSMLNANAQVRLSNLGESQNISKVAEAAIKLATGQELTNAEDKLLLNSQYGVKVAHDLKGDAQAYNFVKQIEGQADATYKSLEKRVDHIYTTSESGKATIHDTNEAVSLDNVTVAKVTDDGMVLRVDGKEVSTEDIDFADDSQSYLYSAVSKIEHITPGAATAIIRGYDSSSGQTVGEYLNGIDEAYTYGYHGYSEADLKAGNFAPKLTGEQATTAYELGKYVKSVRGANKADAIKKMRTALEVETEKAKAEGKEAPKTKGMTITYNNGNGKVVDFDKAGVKLTAKQKAAPALARVMHEMGLGTNFELFASYVNKAGVRVFLDENGVERKAYSGVYRMSDGTVRIDLNAYNGRGLTLNAMAHELTHFIQQWSTEKYEALADFLMKTYEKTDMTMHERVLREQARLKNTRGEDVSYNEAYDEVVANAMSKMLDDGKVMDRLNELMAVDMNLAQKLWEGLKKLLNKFFNAYKNESALFHDAADLMELKADFEQMQKMWAEAFVEASGNFRANLMATEVGVEPVAVEDISMYSYSSLAEAAGFTAVENEDGTRSFTRDGKKVSEVTVEDIDNSPIGAFINFSAEMGDISDAEAMRQKQMFADICTMASKTNDFAMTMQFVGSAVFTGMKANADKQYGTTYDFPSICTKTQAVIDAMSAKMVKLGRGLNTNEIVQLYDDVFASGNPVPCPECYVFSRWIGIGGLLDNIKKYQDYYGDMEVKDVAAAYLKMKAEVSKFADEQGISFGKAKGALTSKLTKEYNKLNEKIEKAQNQGEKVKPADQKRLAELEPMMNTVKSMTWLENVYFADSYLKKVNPNFRVPDSVLFDLNNGEAFATKYKDAWAFRTTQGAGYGKAITPYAEARLGEGVLVTNNTTNAIKGRAQGTLDNFFLQQMGKLDKKSRDALKRARLKQKVQAFIGGQRFQSTSDARYENASDYLLAALEMQAMGGMVQAYTKVDGAVPAFSAWGFSINQSLMPLNGGLDADGNVKDTAVGGMKPEVAFANRNKYESAGTITIGVNDNHIRAMFKQLVRDFIIPYHASGGKADVVAEFRRIQEGKEAKGKAVRSTDYSRTQSDKILSDEVLRWQGKTDAQIQRIHEIRDTRIAILTGGKVNMTVVRSNRFLSALYDKLNGGEWDGVKLAKSKVESQIFPNEFWDQTINYDESAKITKDYLEYCEDLGFLHRFSGMVPSNGKLVPVNGYNENGEIVQLTDLAYQYDENGNKTDKVEDFFWKVLTDRRMYDNNGKYLAQKVVTLNDTTTETVTGFAKNNQGREYDKAKAEALAKKIAGEQYSSQQTDMDSDGNALSKSQQQYFADSKVRDADGRLMVMYHGTANGGAFTVFNGDQLGNQARTSQVGQGFYFTNAKEEAESYTKNVDIYGRSSNGKNPYLHQVYLNITNPFNVMEDTLNLDDVKAVYGDGTYDFFFEDWIPFYLNRKSVNGEVLTKAAVQAMSKEEKVSLYVDYLSQFGTKELLSNMVRAFPSGKQSELLTAMRNRLGYDGIVEEYAPGKYQYVAFSSEQIKNVDNQNPTTNPDIRYSSQETDIDTDQKVTYHKGKTQEVIGNERREETREAFLARASKSLPEVDERGSLAFGFRRYSGQLSKNVRGAEKGLKKLGIPVVIFEQLEGNQNGFTTIRKNDASAIPGVAVFIRYNATVNATEIVGHEGYHYLAPTNGRKVYTEVLAANVNFASKAFIDYQQKYVDDNYFSEDVEIGSKEWNTLMEEIYAYITGHIHSGDPKGEVHKFLRDYDAVKAAWDDLIKKQSISVDGQELYSGHDTDNVSNRSLLANAFEGITKSSIEYKLIQKYKGHIKDLNALEKELSKLNAEIRQIRFGKGKYDAQKLEQLESRAKAVASEINRYDKRLLSLEASEPLRKLIASERKKEAQKTKEHVNEILQNKKVRAEQAELRHKIRKTVRDLDKILNRGNKKQNVKEDLQPVVTKALQAAEILFTENYGNYDMLRNGIGADLSDAEEALVKSCAKMLKNLDKMPTDGYENFQARQEAENRLRTKMSKLKDVFARERKRLNNTTVSSILGKLADAYASLEKSEQSYVQGAYSEPVHNFLKNLQSEVGGTIVMDMTKDQLESVYAAYKMVLTTVRKANQMFNEGLKMSREQLGNAVIEEVLKAGGVHLLGTKMGDAISQFDWNNMKPVWVANRIGSDSFAKLMQGLFDGQYNFARDIDEVRKFKLSMDEKYKPRNWDAEKQYEFESSTGKKFSLNLQQIMSLYAFSKREQAYSHLLNGGFVFEENSTVVVDGKLGIKRTYIHKGAASYKLNEATLTGILDSLTAEQKAYVDEMQKYLSDVMGAKGNEVSMQLYGIKMFNEKFYFPLRSSGAYMEKAKEAELKKQQGQINLVNSGFTHSVKPEAKNPIVLSGFMDVWAEHCNEMSMYHSMVLPMEDFRKVYNYSTIHDENMESASVYQTIQDAYGKAATDYIDQLYKELNAGATVDPRETPYKKLISNFKKAAVMLSGSVVVQQFSSIGRAYAVIDPKYFIGAKVKSDTKLSTVDEMKKYAPVAIIKEMGGFDTGTKGNATAYIKAEKYGKGERIKGLVKDNQYRGDIMGYLPAKADELTWCAIWEAVKRETKANHPKMDVKSEEFLKLAGERFSEVIEKTQVYDSVLARSANMRSKGNFMQMATAFMAEPTTTINLIEDAIRSGKIRNVARVFGSVAVSIILNNALASVVYAMRDDDEEETFLEKYFQSFASGLIDDINPMSYYPFLKDIYSLFQGYDVERSDMSVFADVRDALKQVYKYMSEDTSEMDDDELTKHNKNLWGAFGSFLDAGCSLFGVPFKNVRRDTLAIVNGIKTIGKDLSDERDNSWLSFWDKVGAAIGDTIPVYALVAKDKSKSDKLYRAIAVGDKEYLSRLKSTYKTDSAYQSAVRKALRENDPRIKEAAQANVDGNAEKRNRILKELKSDLGSEYRDYIVDAINAETSKIRNDAKPEKVTGQYEIRDFIDAVADGDSDTAKDVREDIIDTHIDNGKTQTQAEQAFVSSFVSGIEEAYSYNELDKDEAKNLLVDYADMEEEDAADKITYWDFKTANPDSNLAESKVMKYLEFAEPAGVSLDVYEQFVEETKDPKNIKNEWGEVEVTKRAQVLEVIDSLPISWQQKDALYLAAELAESKIWDVPW